MEHAPQLPSLQPSLVPVKPSVSRNTSSRLWRDSQRNSVGSPLIVVWTCVLLMYLNSEFGPPVAASEELFSPTGWSVQSFFRRPNGRCNF